MSSILNNKIVLKVLSRILFILTLALVLSALVSIILKESPRPFLYSASISFAFGILITRLTAEDEGTSMMKKKDAYFTVTFSWLIISVLGSLPYLFSASIPNVINAFFESVSGFTTTGSSILEDIEVLPKSILFWRSFTHWIGGIGIIVLVIIVMPTLHIGGYNLFTLESSLQEKIQPKIKAVGFRLLWIYLALTATETLLLMAGKMDLFESVCHAFGTVATGGFSPRNTSVCDYSPYIQYVIMLFMLLAGTNFVIHYYLLKREFKKISENDEVRFYLFMIAAIGIFITCVLYFNMHKSLESAFRESFFQVISIITCTGYASADYLLWPRIAWLLIFFSLFLGGSTGSTAGGVKMARYLILIRNINRAFKRQLSPHAVIPIRLNHAPLKEAMNRSVISFISVYFLVFITGTLVISLLGVDGETASSSVATCMAGIGPGIGTVGPASNFAHLPQSVKLILAFLMLLGRLEIYTIMLLFTRHFWRK